MNPFKILVGTDFSPFGEAALSVAVSLADDKPKSEILLVHIIEAVMPGYDEELGVLEPEKLHANLEILAASRKTGYPVEPIVEYGNPATEILKIAEKRDVDLIVLGTHGRSGLLHLLVGSVAEAILRGATCPVLTVNQTAIAGSGSEFSAIIRPSKHD